MKRQRHKQYLSLLILIAVIVAVGGTLFWNRPASAPAANQAPPKTVASTPAFNKALYSLTDPTSPWVIVNKHNKLPDGYVPPDLVTPDVSLRLSAGASEMKLRQTAATAIKQMFNAAKAQGQNLLVASAYRSQASQKALHDLYVAQKGAAAADTDSARAGYSEHQTGWGVDVGRADYKCQIDPCFANTTEGAWVAANSYKYGFVVRYLPGKQSITGYVYEPWHLRYVGTELAQQVQTSGQTLEEFFGLEAAPGYL